MSSETADEKLLAQLGRVPDTAAGRYRQLNGVDDYGEYLDRPATREADNRRSLLPHRDYVVDLERAAFARLPGAELVSVRTRPMLRRSRARPAWASRRARLPAVEEVTVRIKGPPDHLALLEPLLSRQKKLLPDDLAGFLIPRDLDAFAAWSSARVAEVERLLAHGRALVEAVERLVCRLYAVPAELEDAIVTHAMARAGANEGSERVERPHGVKAG